MLDMIKQARAAVSLLNPDEVRSRATRPVSVGLVAANSAGYGELEDFLLPAGMPAHTRIEMLGRIHRAGDPDVPETVDLVLYQQGIPHSERAFTFHHHDPAATVSHILD